MVLSWKSNKRTKSHSVKKSEIFCCELNFEILFWKGKNLRKHRVYAGFGADSRTRTDDLRITKQMKKYKIHSKQRKTAISFIHWNDCFLIWRCVFIPFSVRKWSINGRWINSRNSHSISHLVRSMQHSYVSFVYFTFLITQYTHA